MGLPVLPGGATAHAAVRQADAVIISTEWSEYRALDWDALALSMRTPIIIDARNVIGDPLTVHATIEQIGKELPKPLAVSLGVTA